MHIDEFVRGKGRFVITKYVADAGEGHAQVPAAADDRAASCRSTTSARRRAARRTRAGTTRTGSRSIRTTPRIAASRTDDWVGIESRAGETVLRAKITERMQPGVVYTTFHFPESGANVITTDNSDWATNCPEYKVTAVQVMPVEQPSQWQKDYSRFNTQQLELLEMRTDAKADALVTTSGK